MDRHHVDPDPTNHFDADPDTDPDSDPTPKFSGGKSEFCCDFYFKQCQFYIVLFYLSRQRHGCHNFQYLDIILKFSGKSVVQLC